MKPCKRCLIDAISEKELFASIRARIDDLPESERAPEPIYAERLSICQSCDALIGGTCMQCGCFVQLRAAKARMHCPHPKRFWSAHGVEQSQ